ncbi:MAG: DUF523 and DUF1722 domain-containing protein [Actinomycetota bacterium]|nr:DUF523 and DUF1722 domain-containing protein [Actinomycetota bacterium]
MGGQEERLRLGVSVCLLGENVRHDGGHKRNTLVTDLLGPHFEWVPVCPEVEAGMSVPREPVHLERSGEGVRMVGNDSGTDHTEAMTELSSERSAQLSEADLRGYIFKSGSPSCGLEKVPIKEGEEYARGRGMFAEAVVRRVPHLPMIEAESLSDPRAREGFIERVFTYHRLSVFFGKQRSVGQVAMFHAQAKLQLEAHAPGVHSEMVKMFSEGLGFDVLKDRYMGAFMQALGEPLSVKSHFDTMRQVANELRGVVEAPVLKEIGVALQEYRKGHLPLAVPLTLLRHYVRLNEAPRFNGQTYLEPEPGELLLRTQL